MVAMAAAPPTPPRTPPMIAPIFVFFPWPRSVAVEVADADVEDMDAVASGSSGFSGKQLLEFLVVCGLLT